LKVDIDLIIPAYFEGESIVDVLNSLEKYVKNRFRVLICYDQDDDNTLTAIKSNRKYEFEIIYVKNEGIGLHGAVMTGFHKSIADSIIMMPADDSWNARIIDQMHKMQIEGSDIVCPSRFMKHGSVEGYPPLKLIIVRTAAMLMHKLAFIPTRDPTNGFRCFSRRVIEKIPVESKVGGTFSIELLVKCHRLGWKISEIPSRWIERDKGKSKFKLWNWIPFYLKWFLYSFATTFLFQKKVNLRK
jgi:glycosyltransferase involved in cell wall biosynthesis